MPDINQYDYDVLVENNQKLESQIKELQEQLVIAEGIPHEKLKEYYELQDKIQQLTNEKKQLEEDKKSLLFQLQDEAMFGMYESEEISKLKKQLEQHKAVLEKLYSITDTLTHIQGCDTAVDLLKQLLEQLGEKE